MADDISWEEHPNRQCGKPTSVECLIRLIDVNEINTAMSYANIKLIVWFYWTDHRLAGRSIGSPLPEKLWKPRLTLERVRVSDLHETVKDLKIISETGDIVCMIRYAACVNDRMDLENFPFDIDDLDITLAANSALVGDRMKGCTRDDWTPMLKGYYVESDDIIIQDWSLISYTCSLRPAPCFDKITLSVFFARNSSFYIYKLVVPLVAITIVNILGLFMPAGDVGNRVMHSSSCLLATVGLLYVVSVEVPKTKYQTVIDRMILFTILFLVLTAIHAVVTYIILSLGWLASLALADVVLASVYLFLYFGILGCLFTPSYCVKRKRLDELVEFDKEGKKYLANCYKVSKDSWRLAGNVMNGMQALPVTRRLKRKHEHVDD